MPKLNRVDWTTFKPIRDRAGQNSFAIEVLIGKPIITYDFMANSRLRKDVRHTLEDDKGNERKVPAKQQQLVPGQAPLPERIRIHSKPLLKNLEKIYGSEISSGDEPVVIIRPFKALAYYEDKIREWCDKLEKRFHVRIRSSKDTTAGVANLHFAGVVESENTAENNNVDTAVGNKESTEPVETGDVVQDNEDEDDPDGYTTSTTALQHLQCLLEFMDKEMSEKLNT
jgi:hypothetical protein